MHNLSKMNKIIPYSDPVIEALNKYSNNTPYLNWCGNNQSGVYYSGWNPLKAVNISFRNESETNNKMWFTIEIPPNFIKSTIETIPFLTKYIRHNDVFSLGLFFERDPNTHKINLLVRRKSFYGGEYAVIYHDCRYFGIQAEYNQLNTRTNKFVKMSKFVVSNEWQDKAIDTGINLFYEKYKDFEYIVDFINNFIQLSISQILPHDSRAIPLLRVIRDRQLPSSVYEDDNSPDTNAEPCVNAIYIDHVDNIEYNNHMYINSEAYPV